MEVSEPSVIGSTEKRRANVICESSKTDVIDEIEVKKTYSVVREAGRVRCIETSSCAV